MQLRAFRVPIPPGIVAALYTLLIRAHRKALDARRRDRTWRFYAYSVVAASIGGFLAFVALLAAWAMWRMGWWWLSIALLVLFGMPPLQPLLSRRVFVPLGLVKTNYWLAHFVSMQDSDAYGMVAAAWAHPTKARPADEAWITTRRDKRIPLGDSEIIVTALLASARGDADTCRQLLRSTEGIVENHPLVRELAGEWLAVDAAARGAWAELDADARRATWPASALTFFLEGVAKRRVAPEFPPSLFELRVRWLLAPYRTVTAALLALPDAATARSSTSTSSTDTSSTGATPATNIQAAAEAGTSAAPALPRAVADHLALASRARPDNDALAATVNAWDVALADPQTVKWVARRALELDAPSDTVVRALRDVATAVTDEHARLAERAQLAAPASHGPVGNVLARKLRHGRLDALEAGFTRWEDRRHAGSVRAPIDEWREFVALRAAYDAAVSTGGLELRRLAFPHAYSKGTSMAVWLWNSRNEYALSHAVSAWLLEEALAVGDTEAIELCTRNTRLSVPTRTGDVKKT
jgi:hypothetical protein